ncbi:MAG: ATP-dependent helicase [Planctomycetota bacterium]
MDSNDADASRPKDSRPEGLALNPQQRAAAEFAGDNVLVLAGAGTGKTSTIVARVAHLVHSGVPPKRILLLTFTRRAAREMKHRLQQQIGEHARRIAAGTFHNFCLQYLRRWPKLFDCEAMTVIDRDDQLQLMKLARASASGGQSFFVKPAELTNYYSYARNTNQTVADYLKEFSDFDQEQIGKIEAVLKEYTARKRACRYFDYDDILHLVARGLHSSAQLREKLRAQYDHLLVDEMQDTNPLQWLILDGMRDPAKLFCVGDDAQSIYAFRGADFENVHQFTRRVKDSEVLKLEENFRSTQEILDLSHWLLDQSGLSYDKRLTAKRGEGETPVMMEFDSQYEEADWIADDLMKRHQTGDDWREHMILTRTAWSARTTEAALIELDIPYRFIGGTQLLQSAHVKDLLSLVRVIENPFDQLAWMRYLTLWKGIGEKTAESVIRDVLKQRSYDGISELLEKRFSAKPRLLESVRECRAASPSPTHVIAAAIDKLTPVLEPKNDDWDRREKDLKLLKRLAEKHATVAEFLETYTLDPITESEASRESEDDVVTLITVHSAKGTESRVCYLIGVQPGNYPHARSIGDEKKEEEERRVLYVAMTRAKNELILTGTVRSYGAFVPHHNRSFQASQPGNDFFLRDVPAALVKSEYGGDEEDAFDAPIRPFRR